MSQLERLSFEPYQTRAILDPHRRLSRGVKCMTTSCCSLEPFMTCLGVSGSQDIHKLQPAQSSTMDRCSVVVLECNLASGISRCGQLSRLHTAELLNLTDCCEGSPEIFDVYHL